MKRIALFITILFTLTSNANLKEFEGFDISKPLSERGCYLEITSYESEDNTRMYEFRAKYFYLFKNESKDLYKDGDYSYHIPVAEFEKFKENRETFYIHSDEPYRQAATFANFINTSADLKLKLEVEFTDGGEIIFYSLKKVFNYKNPNQLMHALLGPTMTNCLSPEVTWH